MYYNTSDVCHLDEGYFCLKVNGTSVAVVGDKVVTSDKPTHFYIKKFQGDICTYVIYDTSK
ncbi:hypothetical protein SCLCIDRAFT_32907 [Scleroderma citrinum Foug A]|uniref:Uncharacterized protein n=1 Tax=Scleroderma citrinum Foug A TaxID=1036808 RepID=A0A0C2ZH39_9AGAM|nr:hypothetical protein SCLCIDRAFT_32907 [Scleroderma citrinum Foug A]